MSSKRRLRRRECERKKRYATPEAARRDAWRVSQRESLQIHAYHCPHCRGYHVGHRPGAFHDTAHWNGRERH